MAKLKVLLDIIRHPSKLPIILLNKYPQLIKDDRKYVEYMWRQKMDYPLNLNNPQTFNEKLQWLKLYDHRPEYTMMVDKYEVKEYVASIIGKEYIIPTLAVYDSVEQIDFDKLPNQFVLKCTHDSGGLVICKDKKKMDIEEAKEKLRTSLKRDYYIAGREWPYKHVKHRIIAEKFLTEGDCDLEDNKIFNFDGEPIDKGIMDYKFMCYNGRCENLFVCTGRARGDLRVDFFDRDWNHLPFYRKYKNSDSLISKPENLEKMVDVAEKIAKKVTSPFSRIDLYSVSGHIYFGEITLYPGNGLEFFEPVEWDYKLGSMIQLPNKIN